MIKKDVTINVTKYCDKCKNEVDVLHGSKNWIDVDLDGFSLVMYAGFKDKFYDCEGSYAESSKREFCHNCWEELMIAMIKKLVPGAIVWKKT